jgi:hypothetical protein
MYACPQMSQRRQHSGRPLATGDVLSLKPEDYKFGRGPITVRITAVIGTIRYPDGPYLQVLAIPLVPSGPDVRPRFLCVRQAVVATARRTDPGPPS